VSKVHCYEIALYDDYGVKEIMIDALGFSLPLDAEPWIMLPGGITGEFGPQVRYLADGLGVEIEEIREVHEKASLDHDVSLPVGDVPAGTMAGLRFEVQGIVGGRPAIVVEHVTRLDDSVAPDWPHGSGYRIEIEGSPSFTVELSMRGEDGDHNTGGLVATAMRIVNAIPYVCAADPGLLSTLDLPLFGARHLMPA